MGRITHAYITYTDDTKKFFTVPVTNIKLNKNSETHIEPENDTDFEKRRRYYVKWSDCDAECIEDHAHFGYYSAYIIYLGESVENIKNRLSEGGRIIVPHGVPSSESDEPVKPLLRRQKQNALVQEVQKKKNSEVLQKHKTKTFLSARKKLIDHSDNKADPLERENVDNDDEDEQNSKGIERIRAKEKLRIRKDLFGEKDVSLEETADQVNNDISHEEGTGCSTTSTCHTMNKPIITRNEPINMNLKMLQKSNINHDKSTERNVEKKNTGRNNNNVIVRVGGSTEQSSTRMVTNVFYRKVNNANRSEAVPVEVHPRIDDDDLLNESDDQQDDDNVEQVPVREHLPLRGKKRNQVNNEGGPRKKVHRELLEALEYYENQEADPGERKRYEIAGNMIYLGEGLEVSAPVWFLIQQDKPQMFFSGMLELLWTHRNLVNRCQNMDKVTTRLQGRSPMKVLTPSKKRLSFSLYSDYLDKKKIKGTEKMQCLSKVPYLITTKINYLRSKYYEKAT